MIGQPGPRSERERMEEVRAIAGRAGVDEAAVRRGAPYSEIIQAVGDSAGPAASAIYLSWKRGAGNNRAVSTAVVSSFLNAAGRLGG